MWKKAIFKDNPSTSEWMTNLPSALQEMPLCQLAIPGSHDSGSYNLTTEVASSAPAFLRHLASLPGFTKLFGPTVLSMATCQTLTVGQQLDAGIRHLDFRISSKEKENDLYFVHSVYGTKIKDALVEIKQFLDDHLTEVVILDLHQFYGMDAAQHTAFIALLKSTFGSKFCQPMDIKDLTLKNIWDKKKQLICIYQDDAGSKETEFWTSDVIQSPWPNTPSPETCVTKLTAYMNQAVAVTNRFFVCQAVVTPNTSYILSHCGGSLHKMTQKLNPVFNTWLSQSPDRWKHQPNVIIHDFVDEGNYVQNVLDLNKHRE